MSVMNMFKSIGIGWFLIILVMIWHMLSFLGLSQELYGFYAGCVYPIVRATLGIIAFYFPTPLWFILLGGLIFLTVLKYRSSMQTLIVNSTISRKIRVIMRSVLNVMSGLAALFYILWAFHYYRPAISIEMNLPESRLTPDLINDEFKFITRVVNQQREWISQDTAAFLPVIDAKVLSDHLQLTQNELLASWSMPIYKWTRVKSLYPKGMLLSISTAGFYLPFAGEGYIDAGLHPLQWPFTMAHEMAHVQGLTDEGSCNFIGLLTCLHSKDAVVRYSGLLSYWGYLYRQMMQLYPDEAKIIRNQLNIGVKADLKAIRMQIMKYPDIFPRFRNLVYDTYLKTHGVPEGLRSYDGVVLLMIRWKESKRSFPIVPAHQ